MPKIVIEQTPEMKSGGWIGDVAKSIKKRGTKGKCTPMTKPGCTGRARALAKTFKKMAKHDQGGLVEYGQGGMTNHGIGDYNPHWYKGNSSSSQEGINPTTDVDITHTVKPVDEESATIEAEKGEIIVKPALTGIYKILGKKHSKGGTALAPEPGSFIFSVDPSIKITPKDKEIFEFKKGGSPADVLNREIDIKEYNRYISVLQDPHADNIAKTTAQIMIAKYQKTMGQVAYLQEAKKKKEIPEFAQGTAPVDTPELDQQENEQEMYKAGGMVKFQAGGQPQLYPGAKLRVNSGTPRGQNNAYDYPQGAPKEKDPSALANEWLKVGIDIQNQPDNVAQKMMYDWALKNNPDLLRNNLWGKFGLTNMGRDNINKIKALGIDLTKRITKTAPKGLMDIADASKLTQDQLTGLRDLGYVDGGYKSKNTVGGFGVRQFAPDLPDIPGPVEAPAPVVSPTPAAEKPKEDFNAIPSLGYDVKGYLTPAQKANLSYLGLQAMGIKKYMPMREQVDLPQVRFDKQDVQPYLNNINNQSFQSYNSLNAVDPRNAKLMGSNIAGKSLDAANTAIGQVAGQNIQTGNAENQFNTQQATNQAIQNANFSHQYYDQTVTSNQNYDDEKRFANNQVASAMNKYQSEDDALAWQLASTYKYGSRKVTDPKTGKVYNQPIPIMQYMPDGGIRYNADVADIRNATGTGRVDQWSQIQGVLDKLGIDPNTNPKAAYSVAALVKAFGNSKNPIDSN